jgi:oxygen-independent coproporphyrinogen-3 oxidase
MPVSVASARRPGLYLHIPFCSAICPYCDFAVTTGKRDRRGQFLDALLAEITLGMPAGIDGELDTVYLGGGTPSILDLEELAALFETLRAFLPIAADVRVCLEANPEDVTAEGLAGWRRLGVTMLSLGVQSLDDETLRYLGRRHRAAEARRAVEQALAAGFETVSMDLIYGIPGRDAAAWRRELVAAVQLAPDHLSCYQLTVHEGTPFGRRQARGERIEVPESIQARLFRATHELLAAAGYEGYEVSNFAAAARHRSPHNTKYWDHTPYLGLGPSAHSFDGGRRWWNERGVEPWQRLVGEGVRPIAGSEELEPRDLLLERLMLALRTAAGVDLDEIDRRFGVDLEATDGAVIDRFESAGLVAREGRRLRPTLEGLAVADSLVREMAARELGLELA